MASSWRALACSVGKKIGREIMKLSGRKQFSRHEVLQGYLQLNARFAKVSTSPLGTLNSVTTGRFQEAEPHWLLSGNQSEERTVSWVPRTD